VKRRILLGTYVLSAGYCDAYFRKAQQVRTLLRRDFDEAFSGCDVLITPTTPETAFRIGEKTSDPLTMYLSDVFTVSANLAGLPGVSVPCGFAHQMPVGLQILGRPLDDATPLRVADAFQRRTDLHLQRPPELP
jgi:aspartyl-tRNA(Asn)/glutamyl-tRNA(Gln) amidotransferase subunit A